LNVQIFKASSMDTDVQVNFSRFIDFFDNGLLVVCHVVPPHQGDASGRARAWIHRLTDRRDVTSD
jgi:hypothetical protein